ncbi:hypothetical protein SCUP234_00061 [Seiridium cupressi]|uniref:Cyanovirin-N domain-containing protein n=1 Tax=Seiridium unicorne TaxID=138068 RepID=A0ABR2VFR0_9PEZI
MKMLTSLAFALFASMGVLASPYLEFCSLLDVQTAGTQGIVIQASCGGRCEQLNIVPCLANSYGTIVPAGLTNGNFNNTCRDCTLGTIKNDTESYGALSCICASGAPDVVINTTFQTANAIRYETTLGMTCPYGNSSAIRSVECGTTTIKHPSIVANNKRDRKVRRSMRSTQLWKP